MQILGIANSYASEPVNAPTSLSAIPTDTNVAISFTAPTNDGGTAITNYEYSFNNSTWTALSPADAISPITVSGLTQNTAYSVYLRAVNVVGSGPASSAVTFTTAGVPTGTTTISSVSVTDTVATVNFSTTAGGSAITGYDYYLTSWVDAATSTSPKVISGLTQNTGYTVYMRPKNAYGSGSQSAGFGFTTAGVPTGAATITSISVGTTTATVNFSVAAGGGAITGYDLYVANQTNAWNNTTGSPISVTGLTANSYYAFYVRAKNAYGVGPQSAGVGATTNPIFMSASGGSTYDYASGGFTYRSHTFTGSSNFVVSTVGSFGTVDALIVAGGGGAGQDRGGGGGAGGFRTSYQGLSATTYAVTVGGGGATSVGAGASNGTNSFFSSISSTGGGRGANIFAGGYVGASSGGSGGGGNPGSGAGAGNAGGYSPVEGYAGGGSNDGYLGGGGGGAAGVGTANSGGAGGAAGSNDYRTGGAESYAKGGRGLGASEATGSQYGAGGGTSSASNNAGVAGNAGVVIIRYRIA